LKLESSFVRKRDLRNRIVIMSLVMFNRGEPDIYEFGMSRLFEWSSCISLPFNRSDL
jgi:hypothetical protein